MTREEAIQMFEPYLGNDCYTLKFQTACSMAIAALMEQEERSKWCEKCRDESIKHHGIATATTGSRTIYRAKFCPKCGRRLEEV